MILIIRKSKNGNHGMITQQQKKVILEPNMICKFFNLNNSKNDIIIFLYSYYNQIYKNTCINNHNI